MGCVLTIHIIFRILRVLLLHIIAKLFFIMPGSVHCHPYGHLFSASPPTVADTVIEHFLAKSSDVRFHDSLDNLLLQAMGNHRCGYVAVASAFTARSEGLRKFDLADVVASLYSHVLWEIACDKP